MDFYTPLPPPPSFVLNAMFLLRPASIQFKRWTSWTFFFFARGGGGNIFRVYIYFCWKKIFFSYLFFFYFIYICLSIITRLISSRQRNLGHLDFALTVLVIFLFLLSDRESIILHGGPDLHVWPSALRKRCRSGESYIQTKLFVRNRCSKVMFTFDFAIQYDTFYKSEINFCSIWIIVCLCSHEGIYLSWHCF